MDFTGGTVNSRFKKDLKMQIHLHKAFFSDNQFLDSLHKSFLNQTTLNSRKEKWTFLNREFTVLTLVFILFFNFWHFLFITSLSILLFFHIIFSKHFLQRS
jgi:hypothetical protein